MIYINKEVDEIDIKLITSEFNKVKEFRIATFGLYQFWISVFISFIISASPIPLAYILKPPEIIKKT